MINNFEIIPLHSTLSETYSSVLFNKNFTGKRKIIVATNIAESSITVPDVILIF